MSEERKRKPLSDKQRQVLGALLDFVAANAYQPSFDELAEIVNVSNVQPHMVALEAKGWIVSTGRPRAIIIPAASLVEFYRKENEND